MSFKVNGKEVHISELKQDVSLKFDDLTQQGQTRLLLENKDTFLYDALISEYEEVHLLAMSLKEEYSQDAVNKMIRDILKIGLTTIEASWILELIDVPDFKLDDDNRNKFSTSEYLPLKNWVASDKYTPSNILEGMFYIECVELIESKFFIVFDTIVKNPNFKLKFNETSRQVKVLRNMFSKSEIKKIMDRIDFIKQNTTEERENRVT